MMCSQSSKRLLVTGASGFFGSEICRQACASGLSVHRTDRKDHPTDPTLPFTRADLLESPGLVALLDRADAVIHCAGLAHIFSKSQEHAEAFTLINETATARVAEAATKAGVRHLVLISTVAVYGGSTANTDEDAECSPEGPYAVSKWRAEQRAREATEGTSTQLTILRLATLYGEGDPGNVARLIRLLDRGRFIWIGSGMNRKSLIHREDAARAVLSCLQHVDGTCAVFNVSAPPCTMREIVEGISEALGRRAPRWHIPSLPVQLASRVAGKLHPSADLDRTVQKWVAHDCYDAARFRAAFGFETRVRLEDGLRREVAWYRRSADGLGASADALPNQET